MSMSRSKQNSELQNVSQESNSERRFYPKSNKSCNLVDFFKIYLCIKIYIYMHICISNSAFGMHRRIN